MTKLVECLALFAKGMAMGAADVVPGVSGGTIAFITGIYDRLLSALKNVNPLLLKVLRKEGIASAWRYMDGTFLACVFGGILTSVLTLAHAITYWLATYPEMLWSFFFGLIVVSGWHMLKQIRAWNAPVIVALLVGASAAYGIGVLSPTTLDLDAVTLFFAGAIAICAMILPGVSGSFLLLLMGLYSSVIDAVKELNVEVLWVFGLGCIGGLLCFSHVLSWLLKRYRDVAMALLTGLMLGALGKVWPWKETLTTRVNSSGIEVPLMQHNVSPSHYEAVTGHSAYLSQSIGLMILAVILVLIFERLGKAK